MAGSLGALNILLGLDTAQFTSALSKTDYQSQAFARKFTKNMQSIDASADKASRAISGIRTSMQTVVALSAGAFSAREVLRYADGYTELQNRLRLVTKSTDELKTATGAVFDIALRTNQSIASTSTVFQRFAQNADVLGLSLGDVAGLTDTVSKAIAISGGSAASAEAALVQFGQALASGTLRGEELNSVMEQAPGLAQAIARGLNIPIGSLRTLAAEGKITSTELIKALGNAAKGVDQQFSTRIVTVSQSLTNLSTSFSKFIGEANTGTGVTSALAGSIGLLANNLDLVATAAVTFTGLRFASGIAEATKRTLAQVAASKAEAAAYRDSAVALAQTATLKLRNAEANALQLTGIARVAAFEKNVIPLRQEQVAALNAATLATTAYSRATSLLTRGMALVGGPIGLLTIAITGGMYAFGKYREGVESNKTALTSLGNTLDDITKKFKTLNKEQQASTLRSAQSGLETMTSEYRGSLNALQRSFTASGSNDFGFGGWETLAKAKTLFSEATIYLDDMGISSDDARQKVIDLVEAFAKEEGITQKSKDALLEKVDATVASRRAMIQQSNAIAAATGKALNLVDAYGKLNTGTKGLVGPTADAIKKYGELVDKLNETIATFGATEAQQAVYKASLLGVSDAQVALVGVLGGTNDALEKLKKATAEGNSKAAEAARAELRILSDKESKLRAQITLQEKLAKINSGSGTASEKLIQGAEAIGSMVTSPTGNARSNESIMLTALMQAGVQSQRSLSILMGQLSHESAGFRQLVERASGSTYEGRADLGNTQAGDGSRYKGRGFIQLTGRSNYERIGSLIGQDLVNNPDLASNPQIAAKIAIAYLQDRGVISKAASGDIEEVTKAINGGTNGLADRKNRTSYYEGGGLNTLLAEQNAIAAGTLERSKKLSDFELAAIKRASDLKDAQYQAELKSLELVTQKDAAYYSQKMKLTGEANTARLAGIDAEIEILKRIGDDTSSQKILDLETEKQKILLEQKTTLADINHEQKEAWKATDKAIQDAQKSAQLYIDTIRQNDQRTLDAYGLGDRQSGLAERKNAAADQYAENVRQLDNSYSGKVKDASYDAQVAAYKRVYEEALKQSDIFYALETEKRADWMNGFTSALANYTDSANNMAENVSTVFGTVTSGLEDAWVNFVTTGKLSFSDLARSVIADIARIQARSAISSIFNLVAGSLAGGALGGATVNGSSYMPSGGWSFATGGYTGDGGKYQPAGIVHKGEGVLNQEEMMRLGGVTGFYALRQSIARGYANGGVAGQASQRVTSFGRESSGISIVNQTQGRVDKAREVTLSDGERMLLLEQMEDRIAGSWANPNSKNATNFRKHVKAERVL